MRRLLMLAAAQAALSACAAPGNGQPDARSETVRDCHQEGAQAYAAARLVPFFQALHVSDRVAQDAEAACFARPLNAAEQSQLAEKQRQEEARQERERQAQVELQRINAETREASRRVERFLAQQCNGRLETAALLLTESPFAVTGRCYQISLYGADQWLSPTRALVLRYGVLLETNRPISGGLVGNRYVRGVGAYQYQAASGAFRAIPHVIVIDPPN